MKHLKLYEGYLNEYYLEINEQEARDFQGQIEPIDTKTRKWLLDKGFNNGGMDGQGEVLVMWYRGEKLNLNVYQLPDEWYLVKYLDSKKIRFFKCDQFEGLKKCIEDLI